MRAPSLQTGWRLLVPVVVAGAIALGAAATVSADTALSLPRRSAAQLLHGLEHLAVDGFSGSVVQTSAMGLPELPVAATGELSVAAVLTGTNTVKIWYGGPERQRVAVLDPDGESDQFRDGTQLWQWDSGTRVAVSAHLPEDAPTDVVPLSAASLTPEDVARQAIAAIEPSTALRVESPATVAGRPVYRLVLEPRSTATRIGSVRLSLDSRTALPLAVQVFARGDTVTPAIDLAFTHVDFGVPDAANFSFTPPPGSTVTTTRDHDVPGDTTDPDPWLGALSTTLVGTGWSQVAVVSPPGPAGTSRQAALDQLGPVLKPVSGPWGSGRLLQTSLLSVLFDDDGCIAVGAVDPPAVYAAAATP